MASSSSSPSPLPNKSTTTEHASGDPFSHLPGHVLIKIISFLPPEDAAKSAAVSRRWRSVWPCSRKVVLDETAFAGVGDTSRASRLAFVAFARRFASEYLEPKVDSFRLCFSHPLEFEDDVKQWMDIGLKRNVEELELDFSGKSTGPIGVLGSAELPEEAYGLQFLSTLKISGCSLATHQATGFRSLRVLSISRVDFTSTNLETLIKTCSTLEDLSLIKLMSLDAIKLIDDDHRSLRRLTIVDCRWLDQGFVVEAPELTYFKYTGHVVMPFILDNLTSLDEAELDFFTETEFSGDGDHLCEILHGLQNARVLTVCSYIIQVIPSGEEVFHLPASSDQLRHLILKKTAVHRNELPGIAFLLRSYPLLECLTIKMAAPRHLKDYDYPYEQVLDGRRFWEVQILPIPCLHQSLKTVKVEGFRFGKNEIELVLFLLGNARMLEEVIVDIYAKVPTEALGKLAMIFGRVNKASNGVRIVINGEEV